MMMTRWTPSEVGPSLLDRMDRELGRMDRLWEDFTRPLGRAAGWGGEFDELPAIELREGEGEYVLKADVPGLRREELEVDVAADHVTLRGNHEEEREEREGDCMCSERGARRFERTVGLPGEVRVDDVKASMKDGVLTLHLPKAHETSVRRIEVTEH